MQLELNMAILDRTIISLKNVELNLEEPLEAMSQVPNALDNIG